MKIAFVNMLPFHHWLLSAAVREARLCGHEAIEITHHPKGAHDWASAKSFEGQPEDVDYIVAPDMPFNAISDYWPGVPIVATRHSLASRGNTWDAEQARADIVATWSAWDEMQWARRLIKIKPWRVGCIWAADVAAAEWHGNGDRVTWAPSWNEQWSARSNVVEQLGRLQRAGWKVRIRAHAVVEWREPGVLRSLVERHMDADAIEWSSGLVPAVEDLSVTDVLVSDVSGIALLACSMPSIGLVHVTPPEEVLASRKMQHDPDGPEWQFREMTGEVVKFRDLHDLPYAVDRAACSSGHRREQVSSAMIGPRDWTISAPRRLIEMMEGRHV